jgi:subtilisin family serine protease
MLKQLLMPCFWLLALATMASNQNSKSEYYRLPEGVSASDYQAGRIIFKVKEAYRSNCSESGVAILPLNLALNNAGCTLVKKVFSGKNKPEQEKNLMGQKLADLSLIYVAEVNAALPIEKVINSLLATGVLQYAEPSFVYKVRFTPNDPQVGSQWFINKIQAYTAWDIQQGDTSVVIGIVDSGTDWDHPDLQANLKLNYNDPINGIDDDQDGYIDNYRGWDMSMDDNNPMVDMSDHGSHVSGCAAAVTNNGTGVSSPGFNCKFLPVKCANATSTTTIDRGYEGIVFAADHGCQIINCSWGGNGGGSFGQDIITYASVNMGALVVCAAGNTYTDVAQYPAAYNYAFSVAATTSSDVKSSFSTYNYTVDIAAPGSNILSTVYNNTYTSYDGTSMASPITAGCAAVVKSQFPSYNNMQIAEQLRMTADNIYGISGNANYIDKLGTGRVNLYKAVTQSPKGVRMDNISLSDNNDQAFVAGDTLNITGDILNLLAPLTNLSVSLSTTSSYVTLLNNSINPGAMATLDMINTAATPFLVKINNNAPVNSNIIFKLAFTDGTLIVNQYFSVVVNVDYINININEVATTITSKGRLFYYGVNQVSGLGFNFNGENLVYDGGLMIGNNNLVSDNCRDGANFDDDFLKQVAVQRLIPSVKSEFDLTTTFNDNNVATANRLRVLVKHNTYAWSTPGNTRFIIVEYRIKNNGTNPLSTLYAGICADWDIQTYNNNKSDIDASRNLGYTWCTDAAGIYAGVKLLTPTPFNCYSIDNVTGGGGGVDATADFTNAEKYTTLSTSRPQAGNTLATGNDVIQVVSSGPFNLSAGDSVTVAFALLAGENLSDLQTSADSAQIKYNGTLTSLNEVDLTHSNFAISDPYPNPSDGNQITLPYYVKNSGIPVIISLTDISGRMVKPLFNGASKGGKELITFNGTNLNHGVYLIRIQAGNEVAWRKLILY